MQKSFYETLKNTDCQTLVKIAQEFQGREKPLPIDDLIRIYDRLPFLDHLPIFVIYHTSQTYPPEQYAKLLMHVIASRSGIAHLQYTYNPETAELDLAGNEAIEPLQVKFTLITSKLGKLRPELNLLSTLPLNTIRLQDTSYNRENIQNILPHQAVRIAWD